MISWAGMRGVVTLAAALILPMDVPYRPILLLVAFVVVVGTLLTQGCPFPGSSDECDSPHPIWQP